MPRDVPTLHLPRAARPASLPATVIYIIDNMGSIVSMLPGIPTRVGQTFIAECDCLCVLRRGRRNPGPTSLRWNQASG